MRFRRPPRPQRQAIGLLLCLLLSVLVTMAPRGFNDKTNTAQNRIGPSPLLQLRALSPRQQRVQQRQPGRLQPLMPTHQRPILQKLHHGRYPRSVRLSPLSAEDGVEPATIMMEEGKPNAEPCQYRRRDFWRRVAALVTTTPITCFSGFGGLDNANAVDLFGGSVSVKKMSPVGPSEASTLLRDVYDTVARGYVDANHDGFTIERWQQLMGEAQAKTYEYKEQVYEEVRSALSKAGVDEFTSFLEPSEVDALTKYDISGVGINLVNKQTFLRKIGPVPSALDANSTGDDVFVLAVLKNSAAANQGLELGDMLISVDGTPTRNMAPFDVLSRIQGKESDEKSDTAVEIQAVKGKSGEMVSFTIPRPRSDPASGNSESPLTYSVQKGPKGIRTGVIALSDFSSKAARAVEDAVKDLEEQGVDRYVLDLRFNLGGIAQEAVQIAGLFMGGEKPVVYTVSNTGELLEALDEKRPPLTTKPLIVRVNFLTASASEILAGALQDNCRAVLVGTKTFGKGVIQGIFQFSDGSGIKLTIGKYLTPRRRDINKKGIYPDFFLMPSPEKADKKLTMCESF